MSLPPANWYPDPEGYERLRYWDGTQWTNHYHEAAPQAPSNSSPAPLPASASMSSSFSLEEPAALPDFMSSPSTNQWGVSDEPETASSLAGVAGLDEYYSSNGNGSYNQRQNGYADKKVSKLAAIFQDKRVRYIGIPVVVVLALLIGAFVGGVFSNSASSTTSTASSSSSSSFCQNAMNLKTDMVSIFGSKTTGQALTRSDVLSTTGKGITDIKKLQTDVQALVSTAPNTRAAADFKLAATPVAVILSSEEQTQSATQALPNSATAEQVAAATEPSTMIELVALSNLSKELKSGFTASKAKTACPGLLSK